MRRLIAGLLLVSCASAGPVVVQGPDGERWYSISCSARKACYQAASHKCPDGYIENEQQKFEHEMLFQCKDP